METPGLARGLWISLLLGAIALVYWVAPARSYTIHIVAEPEGEQRFYVVTHSGRAGFHGRDVNRVAEGFVTANQPTRIELDPEQIQWFGTLSVAVHHPEYFSELEEVERGLLRLSISIEPLAWSTALSRSPRWQLEYPDFAERDAAFLSDREAHRIILLSDVHYHLLSLSRMHLERYAENGVDEPLRRSLAVAPRIVEAAGAGIREDPAFGVEHVEFHRKQLGEIQDALDDIQRRALR